MGVRYDAEKKKVGMYYSTPLYQFRMKCMWCDMYYVIETDPEVCAFVYDTFCKHFFRAELRLQTR